MQIDLFPLLRIVAGRSIWTDGWEFYLAIGLWPREEVELGSIWPALFSMDITIEKDPLRIRFWRWCADPAKKPIDAVCK